MRGLFPFILLIFVNCLSTPQVEDGRLYYDKKWYGRYQNVFVECREIGKVPAVIQSICMRLVISMYL